MHSFSPMKFIHCLYRLAHLQRWHMESVMVPHLPNKQQVRNSYKLDSCNILAMCSLCLMPQASSSSQNQCLEKLSNLNGSYPDHICVILSLPVSITTHPYRCMHTERRTRRRRRRTMAAATMMMMTTTTTLTGSTVWGCTNNCQ